MNINFQSEVSELQLNKVITIVSKSIFIVIYCNLNIKYL